MNNENRELLQEVISKNLKIALDANPGSDDEKQSMKLAMDAIDRDIAITKNDDSYQEHTDELEFKREMSNNELEFKKEMSNDELDFKREMSNNDSELKKREINWTWVRWGVELTAATLVAPLIEKSIKEGFAQKIMLWETDNTFLTTPGRRIGDFFRFKK